MKKERKLSAQTYNIKELGHFWLGYIRMMGHLQLSAHLANFETLSNRFHLVNLLDFSESKVLSLSLTCCKCYLDIVNMAIESVSHPLYLLRGYPTFSNVTEIAKTFYK